MMGHIQKCLRFTGALTMVMTGYVPLFAQLTYSISPKSNIQISGTSTVSDWQVRALKVSGELTLTPGAGKSAADELKAGTISRGMAALQVADIKSEKGEAMDSKMYKALKHEAHPTITFVLTQPLAIAKTPGTLSAAGNVELAGVTRPMTFELNVDWQQSTIHLHGSRAMKLSDFNIEAPSAMFGQIETGDEITVHVDLYFTNGKASQ